VEKTRWIFLVSNAFSKISARKLIPSSADLTELGRTPVTVISSGCKSFLDIPRTLEYLETEGVCVGTFADGREGSVDFPAFFTRDSGFRSPRTIQNEAEAAAVVCKYSLVDINLHLN
jgi:pseudouridine-5'-phosphate glycosidase/pseudouridine kinase